jgi:outer membrane protein
MLQESPRGRGPAVPRARRFAVALAGLTTVCLTTGLAPARAADGAFRDPLRTESALEQRTAGIVLPSDCGTRTVGAGPLKLSDAVDLALCRNPDTRAAWASARQQAAALGVARSDWLPGLDASGGSTWSDRSATTAASGSTRRSDDAALSLSWTLYDFGARSANTTAANRLLDAAAAQLDRASQGVVYDTVQAYYEVVAAESALAARREAENASARSLEVAKGRFEVGVATRADFLQTETAYGQAVLDRVQAEGGLAAARGQLAILVGEPADRMLALAPDPVPESVPPLTAKAADLLAAAERQRPDLAAARAQRDAAAADVDLARAAGRPTLSVGASQNYVKNEGFPSQDFRSVGISVRWPVFTGFQTKYRVRQAEATRDARDADVDRVRLQVSLDVWTAYASLTTAGQQLDASAKLLASAAENERVALGRYQAGVGTIVDVLTAQSAAASARQQRIGAERAWQVARAQLALSTGRLANAAPLQNNEGGSP